MSALPLLLGRDHECGYLPQETARSVFVDPDAPMTVETYSSLVTQGFRRSGRLVYRPYCRCCAACLPARVSARNFAPNRSQRRIMRRNQDLAIELKPARFNDEHLQLFFHYQSARHEDGGMRDMSRQECIDFLAAPWSNTCFVEFRDADRTLLSVAVVDQLVDGLSAVYTFFSPDQPRRGLGIFAVTWQLAEAKRRHLDWVYLGYWIRACRKMHYKREFHPMQILVGGKWMKLETFATDGTAGT